jgi:hypothetical protein
MTAIAYVPCLPLSLFPTPLLSAHLTRLVPRSAVKFLAVSIRSFEDSALDAVNDAQLQIYKLHEEKESRNTPDHGLVLIYLSLQCIGTPSNILV